LADSVHLHFFARDDLVDHLIEHVAALVLLLLAKRRWCRHDEDRQNKKD
jgi:hypothetical protein